MKRVCVVIINVVGGSRQVCNGCGVAVEGELPFGEARRYSRRCYLLSRLVGRIVLAWGVAWRRQSTCELVC